MVKKWVKLQNSLKYIKAKKGGKNWLKYGYIEGKLPILVTMGNLPTNPPRYPFW